MTLRGSSGHAGVGGRGPGSSRRLHHAHRGPSKKEDEPSELKKAQVKKESDLNPPMVKGEFSSPGLYALSSPELSKLISRGVRVPPEEVESLLNQNFALLSEINSCDSMDDPNYLANLGRLHQNLLFLARISDQPN